MQAEAELTPDTPIVEAGRFIMAAELATMRAHEAALWQDADVTAVHETRKAIRRTFTAVKLFHPFFEPGILNGYRRQFKKIMRRLGRCRDTAVFLQKLEQFRDESGELVDELIGYWLAQKAEADEKLRHYLSQPKRRRFFEAYGEFTQTPEMGVIRPLNPLTPITVRHLAPMLIYQRVAIVRAYGDHLHKADIERLHQLRIQCKELRYALRFLAPLLGPEIEEARRILKQLQELLGDLNDASVALSMLDETVGRETAVSIYRAAQEAEIGRLVAAFPALWAEFDSLAWRQKLAKAIVVL